MSNTSPTVTADHRPILEQVARYGLTTAAAVAGDRVLPIKTVPTAKRRLVQLVKARLLGQAPLYRKRRYCYLTAVGADLMTQVAAHPNKHGPLSEPAKIRAYAMLAFCCLSSEPRTRLTRQQFERTLPHLYQPGMPMNYYIASRPPRLGFLRIDVGRAGRWDRIIQTVRHDIESHWQQGLFRTLIEKTQFEMAVITATTAKCHRLRNALADDRRLRPVRLRIVAIPELIHLLAPPAVVPRQ